MRLRVRRMRLCLRVRRGRAMSRREDRAAAPGDGPAEEELRALHAQYARQSEWFYGVRSNLLRRVGIGSKKRVLELGCGTGAVTPELTRRCGGEVVAVDVEDGPLRFALDQFAGARRAVACGDAFPFADASFDLVFTQMLFLWLADPGAVTAEVCRVLQPGCELLLAAEPDYGGRIEHPEAGLGQEMAAGLRVLGADPEVARKLPSVLRQAGFEVTMGVHPSLFQPGELAAAWEGERRFLASLGVRPPDVAAPAAFLFMPYFWFLARRP